MEILDQEKLNKLAGFIMILRLPVGSVSQECVDEASKNAKSIANELWPMQ